jgi:outer membrane autotransporter protein
VQLTYVGMSEQGYTEEGGGTAIDLEVDETFSQRLWADVGARIGAQWRTRSGSAYSPHVSVGYRANAIDEGAERTVQFASGGAAFTLTDETEGTGGPLLGLGFDATNGYSTFSIEYEGEFGEQLTRHSVNAALRFRF